MSRWRALPKSFYRRPAAEVAPELLGRYLVREVGGERLVARLVEVEAYLGAPDRASHAWGGRRTARNEALYLSGGHAYVYFIYGMHFCLNAVTGEAGEGGAVLLRAAEALAGEASIARRRGVELPARPGQLLSGPGRLCQGLAVDRRLDGVALQRGELRLVEGEPVGEVEIVRGTRIGVGYAGAAASWPLRFAVRGSREVSRPWPWRRG
ncbi:MAG: DNA-3-methyladenine glycosylase [Acidobacteriota bacterium]